MVTSRMTVSTPQAPTAEGPFQPREVRCRWPSETPTRAPTSLLPPPLPPHRPSRTITPSSPPLPPRRFPALTHPQPRPQPCPQTRRPTAKIAINCPADPPHPAGWYSAIVVSAAQDGKNLNLTVEWDGGDIEELTAPDWRYLGEEPDQKGQTSAKDARLRPHLQHVVRRLLCTDRAESRLPMATRRMKKGVADLEWVRSTPTRERAPSRAAANPPRPPTPVRRRSSAPPRAAASGARCPTS